MVGFSLSPELHAIMGVLNVTPDSFSDGGRYVNTDAAIERGVQMFKEGAHIVDVGGESTRPGAEPVSVEDEIARTVPVIEGLAGKSAFCISIDTSKPEVAKACLEAGAGIVNDVMALRAEGMLELCADYICPVCLMHMQGDPRTMQEAPQYHDVVTEVREFLSMRIDTCLAAGISEDRIWLDPGFGFGKTLQHNFDLLRRLDEIVALGFPVVVGTSRKSFIGKALDENGEPLPVEDRLEGTMATNVIAQMKGAQVFRVHEVKEAVRYCRMTASVMSHDGSGHRLGQ